MGRAAKIVLAIIIILIGLFGMAYWGSNINENSKAIDKLKIESQQQVNELKQLYNECRTQYDKSHCDSLITVPERNEIIHD